jgi:hypothetical protein
VIEDNVQVVEIDFVLLVEDIYQDGILNNENKLLLVDTNYVYSHYSMMD